jgi:Ca-activated chloride channel family protein
MMSSLWLGKIAFATPWALSLIAIPVAVLAWELLLRPRGARLSALPGPNAVRIPRTFRSRLLWVPPATRFLGLALLVIALARPQIGQGRVETSTEAVAIQLVVDRSPSMRAPTMLGGAQVTRMDAVKRVVRDFLLGDGKDLPGRPADLVGVVSFARFADTACPPVRDPRTLVDLVNAIEPARPRSEEDGTAIGDGIALAAARLRTAEQDLKNRTDAASYEKLHLKSKVIILLTDGVQTAGERDPVEAAKLAAQWGIKIYAIGIGEDLNQEQYGRTEGGDPQIVVPSEVLKHVATDTGGLFRLAVNGDSLRRIYEEIDKLEKTSVKTVTYVDYDERFMPFAATGGGLICLASLLGGTFLRRTLA